MNINMKYITDFMVELLSIPSPAGDTTLAMNLTEKEFKKLGINPIKTKKGALIATIVGEDHEDQKTICAHIDTLGAMVKEIKSNGRLKMAQVGGFSWAAVEGENVIVKTINDKEYSGTILPTKASVHIHRDEARTLEKTEETMEVRIDEMTSSKDDTLNLGINVGDFIYMDTRTQITSNGFIKSRYLDDKSAVAIVLGICKYFKENNIKPKYTTNFFISNYEEVLHGVTAIPEKTTEFIAVDIGTVGIGQTSDEFSVCIAARDTSGPYNLELKKKLVKVAETNGINYKIDLYNAYGSDASAVVHHGVDVNFACVGPGVDATHHYERTHIKAIENTANLLIHYVLE